MEKFLVAVQEHSKALMTKIEKNQIKIASDGGITFTTDKQALSFEEAQKVQGHYLEYKEESRQYWRDDTKIVVPLIILTHLLKKNFTNLFLLKLLNNRGEVSLTYPKEIKDATDFVPSRVHAIAALLFLLVSAGCLLVFVFNKHMDLNRLLFENSTYLWDFRDRVVGIVVSLVVLLFAIGVYLEFGFGNRNKILNARKNVANLSGNALFTEGVSIQRMNLNTRVLFSYFIDYSSLLAKAIEFQGHVGRFVLKNRPLTHQHVCSTQSDKESILSVVYEGQYVPVVILKHSVIFDKSYLGAFTENDIFLDLIEPYHFVANLFTQEDLRLFL